MIIIQDVHNVYFNLLITYQIQKYCLAEIF